MNKNGDVTITNFLTIVIAVVGIVLLVFAGVRIYNIAVHQETEDAKNLLNVIDEKISLVDEGVNTSITVQGISGDNIWYLCGYDKSWDSRPGKCLLENCICICPNWGSESCQEEGFCRMVNYDNVDIKTVTSIDQQRIVALYEDDRYFESVSFCVPLPPELRELEVEKGEDSLKIMYYDETDG